VNGRRTTGLRVRDLSTLLANARSGTGDIRAPHHRLYHMAQPHTASFHPEASILPELHALHQHLPYEHSTSALPIYHHLPGYTLLYHTFHLAGRPRLFTASGIWRQGQHGRAHYRR